MVGSRPTVTTGGLAIDTCLGAAPAPARSATSAIALETLGGPVVASSTAIASTSAVPIKPDAVLAISRLRGDSPGRFTLRTPAPSPNRWLRIRLEYG
jgi:hypothetical protein